jgi:predicted NUDIX family NTP pyrophosphohydrolase
MTYTGISTKPVSRVRKTRRDQMNELGIAIGDLAVVLGDLKAFGVDSVLDFGIRSDSDISGPPSA